MVILQAFLFPFIQPVHQRINSVSFHIPDKSTRSQGFKHSAPTRKFRTLPAPLQVPLRTAMKILAVLRVPTASCSTTGTSWLLLTKTAGKSAKSDSFPPVHFYATRSIGCRRTSIRGPFLQSGLRSFRLFFRHPTAETTDAVSAANAKPASAPANALSRASGESEPFFMLFPRLQMIKYKKSL